MYTDQQVRAFIREWFAHQVQSGFMSLEDTQCHQLAEKALYTVQSNVRNCCGEDEMDMLVFTVPGVMKMQAVGITHEQEGYRLRCLPKLEGSSK